jgi:hypothetical protein
MSLNHVLALDCTIGPSPNCSKECFHELRPKSVSKVSCGKVLKSFAQLFHCKIIGNVITFYLL